jgi:hypothetical protein
LPWQLQCLPPLFPWHNLIGSYRRPGMGPWLEYLYATRRTAFSVEPGWPAQGCQVAMFIEVQAITSASAVDDLLAHDSQTCIW